jgi:hypothetical protein
LHHEFEETRITKGFVGALPRGHRASAQEDRTVECSVKEEKILCQEGVEEACKQAQQRKEFFEFWKLEERSTEGTFTGLLNTLEDSRRGLRN